MSYTKFKVTNRFGVAPIKLLNNPNISFKAKGIWTYLQSKPDDWEFSAERIAYESRDGVDSVSSGLRELEEHGYLERKKFQNEKGHWGIEYILSDGEKEENPSMENPSKVKPRKGKPLTNKERISKKDISNKDIRVVPDFFSNENDFVFKLQKIYDAGWEVYESHLTNFQKKRIDAPGFFLWKKFVDFVRENNFDSLFETKFLNPISFYEIYRREGFTQNLWEPVLRKILATGVKPEHDLYFRIPEFMKYINNKKQVKNEPKTKGNLGETMEFDEI